MRRYLNGLSRAAGAPVRIAVLGAMLVVLSASLVLARSRPDAIPVAMAETIGVSPSPPHLGTTPPGTAPAGTSTTSSDTVAAARVAPTTTGAPTTTAPKLPDNSTVSAEMQRVPTTVVRPATTAAPAANPAATASTTRAGAATATPPVAADTTAAPATDTVRCVVRLHGKGGTGAANRARDGYLELAPTGNAAGWGGRQWSYFPESGYQSARGAITAAVDGAGCTRVIVDGFSNGAAFAAKLYCRGESFGGRLVGVIVDDPVTDHAVEGCAPAAGVRVTLYWTGALEGTARPGWNCAGADWTCEGGSTIGIAAYSAALGTAAKPSPMGGHTAYPNPPELTQF